MDINNTRYFLFKEPNELAHRSAFFEWDPDHKGLSLIQEQDLRLPATAPGAAITAWQNANPLVIDRYGQVGRLHSNKTKIEYSTGNEFRTLKDGELNELVAPVGQFLDLSAGGDGRIVAPYSDGSVHGVLMFHLGRRWRTDLILTAPVIRAIVDRSNRIWCVTSSKLMLLEGEPLPLPYTVQAEEFEPKNVNPHPLRMVWSKSLPSSFNPLSMCTDDEQIYILMHNTSNEQTIVSRPLSRSQSHDFTTHGLGTLIPFAVDIGIADKGRIAALCPQEAGDTEFVNRDCPVLSIKEVSASDSIRLIHERYPMLSQKSPRFVSSLDKKLRYQAEVEADVPIQRSRPRRLYPLNQPRFKTDGLVTLDRRLDSGVPGLTWHRLYIEANIPVGCNLAVFVKAYDDPSERGSHPFIEQQKPLWIPLDSEIPFAANSAPSVQDRSGLFEILLQRETGNVRRINGRYLNIRLRMQSDGRHSPCVHSMRVYTPRLSYQEAYLPEHFHQQEELRISASASEPSPANGADVRERLLAAMESILTPLEGLIAEAGTLIHPASTPQEHLPWVAEAFGVSLPEHWPQIRHRRLIQNSGVMQRWNGTLGAACLAVDIATDGDVQAGRIVIIENFRLRRTMATILGINFDDRDHPLTLGTGMSGNSIVGDSLILADTSIRTFLSLFAPELAEQNSDDAEAVNEFFGRYAHQVSVLVHGTARTKRTLIEETLKENMPAHLQWRMIETEHPFVLGNSPLLATDTFLEAKIPPRRAKLDETYLGKEGVLTNPVAFSPQSINAQSAK